MLDKIESLALCKVYWHQQEGYMGGVVNLFSFRHCPSKPYSPGHPEIQSKNPASSIKGKMAEEPHLSPLEANRVKA